MSPESLREIFYKHEGNEIHKWDHYFDVYERYLDPYRGSEISLLEIGISQGGSIQLWRKYLGKQARIFAIDVNPDCEKVAGDAKVFIGSQSDRDFLSKVVDEVPDLDVVIDDGGHTMDQQKTAFEILLPKVKQGGVYIVEDTHTSYWWEYYGGLKSSNTFVEYSKDLIDSLYEDHLLDRRRLLLSDDIRNINSITFYDSIVVFEKRLRPPSFHTIRGQAVIPPCPPTGQRKPTILSKIRRKILGETNTFLRNRK